MEKYRWKMLFVHPIYGVYFASHPQNGWDIFVGYIEMIGEKNLLMRFVGRKIYFFFFDVLVYRRYK